jgi:hypothetical protein
VAWTTDDLLSAVRRSGFLPDAHDLSSSDLLAFADEEAATLLADVWKTSREEHRVSVEDIALVSGQRRYRIPRRALSRGVRGITYVDSTSNESPAIEVSPMDAWRFQTGSTVASVYFYVEDDELVLTTAPSTSAASLRVRFYKRPPRMIAVSGGAAIFTAASATTLYFLVEPPSAVSSVGALVDIVRGDSPFPAMYEDLVVANYLGGATNDIVFTTSIVPRDCTVYPPLPQELHPVLVSAVLRRAMEALRDREGVELAEASLRARREAAVNVLEPRNADRKPRLISRSGALRGRGGPLRWVR